MIKRLYNELLRVKFPWEYVSYDFGNAKSRSKAEEHTRELGMDTRWSKAPVKVINRVNKTIKTHLSDYPIAKKAFTYIGESSGLSAHFGKHGIEATSPRVPQFVAFYAHFSELSGVGCMVLKKYSVELLDLHNNDKTWSSKSELSSLERTLSHELGHILYRIIIEDEKILDVDNKSTTFKDEMDRIFNDENIDIAQEVSGYAGNHYDSEEMVAEAFAEYHTHSKPRPVPLRIGKTIDMFLSKVD